MDYAAARKSLTDKDAKLANWWPDAPVTAATQTLLSVVAALVDENETLNARVTDLEKDNKKPK